MAFFTTPSESQPLRFYGRFPVYATTIVTVVLLAGLLMSVLLDSAGVDLRPLFFIPAAFFRGALWQVFTYPLIDSPSFFTPLGILFFYSMGTQCEQALGRPRFYRLLGTLILVPVLVTSLFWGLFGAMGMMSGHFFLLAGLLITMAALFPNLEAFGWIPLKWFAFACIAFGSLMYFPNRDWIGLLTLWASCGAAFGFVRLAKRDEPLEIGGQFKKLFRKKPKFTVVREPSPRQVRRAPAEPDEVESIDPLLDKIARSGLASLTAKERARLEKAREALMKKESGPR